MKFRFHIIFFAVLGLSLLLFGVLVTVLMATTMSQLGQRRIVGSSLPLDLKWQFDASTNIRGAPVVTQDIVMISTGASVIGLDSGTGKLLWTDSTGYDVGDPFVAISYDSTVLFPRDRSTAITAVNLMNGRQQWVASPQGPLGQIISAMAADGTRVYVAQGRNSRVWAYDAMSGGTIWQSPLTLRGITSDLVVKNQSLYAFNVPDLNVLNVLTGKIEKTVQGAFDGMILFDGSNVYLSHVDGLIVKDLSGHVQWRFDPPCNLQNKNILFITVIADRVYTDFGCRTMFALDKATGELLWQRDQEANSASNIVSIKNTGYAMIANGSIISFDLASGADLGRLDTFPPTVDPGFRFKGLATDGISLFFAFGDSKLFKLGPY